MAVAKAMQGRRPTTVNFSRAAIAQIAPVQTEDGSVYAGIDTIGSWNRAATDLLRRAMEQEADGIMQLEMADAKFERAAALRLLPAFHKMKRLQRFRIHGQCIETREIGLILSRMADAAVPLLVISIGYAEPNPSSDEPKSPMSTDIAEAMCKHLLKALVTLPKLSTLLIDSPPEELVHPCIRTVLQALKEGSRMDSFNWIGQVHDMELDIEEAPQAVNALQIAGREQGPRSRAFAAELIRLFQPSGELKVDISCVHGRKSWPVYSKEEPSAGGVACGASKESSKAYARPDAATAAKGIVHEGDCSASSLAAAASGGSILQPRWTDPVAQALADSVARHVLLSPFNYQLP